MGAFDPNKIVSADSSAVAAALAHLTMHDAPVWLPVPHPGNGGQLPLSWLDVRARLTDAEVVEVVAASAPNHCLDGWTFLARSLSALFAGDPHAARHMAYYAQLRAALSMLASVGIGIFNGINFIVDAQGQIERLDPDALGARVTRRGIGTHTITWLALDTWSKLPSSAETMLGAIRVSDTSLSDCLTAIWPSSQPNILTGELIRVWGYDLSAAEDEHIFRNISSYAPHELNVLQNGGGASRPFVEEFWAAVNPDGVEGFKSLDRHILRHLLHLQHTALTQNRDYGSGSIAARYDHLSDDVRALTSLDFLTAKDEPAEHPILASAKVVAAVAEPENMIARAVVLLRLSVGLCHSNFNSAGIDLRQHWRPWLDAFAERRGFWPLGNPLPNFADLWDDVALALEDAQAAPATTFEWLLQGASGLPRLCEAERAGLWALCPET